MSLKTKGTSQVRLITLSAANENTTGKPFLSANINVPLDPPTARSRWENTWFVPQVTQVVNSRETTKHLRQSRASRPKFVLYNTGITDYDDRCDRSRNISEKKTNEEALLRAPSIDRWIAVRSHESSVTGNHPPSRSRNRANRRNYNGQGADLAATEATAVPPDFRRPSSDEFSIRNGHEPKSIFFFRPGAPQRAAPGINSRLTFATLALPRTYRYDHGGGRRGISGGSRSLPTFYLPERRRYYAIDGNAGLYTCTRAQRACLRRHRPARRRGREAMGELVHAPSAACATWAASNSRPVLLRIRY